LYSSCMFPFSPTASVMDRPLLSFDPPQAAMPTTLTLTINPITNRLDSSAPVDYSGFKIILFLNAIVRSAGMPASVNISGPFASNFGASWNGKEITIYAQNYNLLRQRTGPMDIIISRNAGFMVNPMGNLQNDVKNYVQLQFLGQTAQAVLITSAIGVFQQQPTLTYTPAANNYCSWERQSQVICPGKVANLAFKFKTLIGLSKGDVIHLRLPFFEGASFMNMMSQITGQIGQDRLNSSWLTSWNVSSSILTLNVPINILKMSEVTLTVSTAAGIRVPSSGIPLSETYFQFSADALMGNILWTSFASTWAVPSILSNFQFGMQPTVPGDVVTIGGKFLPLASDPTEIVLRPGDSVYLLLPGFTRDMSDNSSFLGNQFIDTMKGDSVVAVNCLYPATASDFFKGGLVQLTWYPLADCCFTCHFSRRCLLHI
jgi:hypothetical protein